MMKPTIHLNGTSAGELERQIDEAYDALNVAFAALKEMTPNGRDYYPQGPDAIYKAQDEHRARLQKITDVQKELSELAEHLADHIAMRGRS